MAIEADLVVLERMIPWKRFHLIQAVAGQTGFLAFCEMWHCRDSRRVAKRMAHGTGFVGLTLVFLLKVFVRAMTTDAVQAARYGVWYSRLLIQSREAIGRSSDE
jgi:hypothetical protein